MDKQPKKFDLVFQPASVAPTERGDYLIYNQCDGYHIVEPFFDDDGDFLAFHTFMGNFIDPDFYCAWALLPDAVRVMFDAFADRPLSPSPSTKEPA